MTKVISLSDKAYESLKKIKGEGESFSDVVMRLIEKERAKPLTEFAGKWVGNDIEKIFMEILGDRKVTIAREAGL
ncbi:MAG: antitoxin VapB family protein [Nitrososphaerales archaeon]